MGTKFDESLTEMTKAQKQIAKKREQKAAEKLLAAQKSSLFGLDKEARKKNPLAA